MIFYFLLKITGQDQNIVGSDNQLPPPYSPPQQFGQQVQHSGQQYGQPPYGQKYVQPPQLGPQYGQPHQGQQYVQQFIHQNPQGFVQTQQPHTIPPAAGYAGIPGNYGYDQSMSPMPPTMMSSNTSTTVVVRSIIRNFRKPLLPFKLFNLFPCQQVYLL